MYKRCGIFRLLTWVYYIFNAWVISPCFILCSASLRSTQAVHVYSLCLYRLSQLVAVPQPLWCFCGNPFLYWTKSLQWASTWRWICWPVVRDCPMVWTVQLSMNHWEWVPFSSPRLLSARSGAQSLRFLWLLCFSLLSDLPSSERCA